MNEPPNNPEAKKLAATLVVRRLINATREKLFAAWTEPELLVRWWGPQGVTCPTAEIDFTSWRLLPAGQPFSRRDHRLDRGNIRSDRTSPSPYLHLEIGIPEWNTRARYSVL